MADFVDFLPNVWRYATADAGVQALVNDGTIGADPFPASHTAPWTTGHSAYEWHPAFSKYGWIFRDVNDERPPRNVESSGKAAVLFGYWSHWSQQVRHHTTKFPILSVFIYADPTRDAGGSPIAQDAESKVRKVWKEIDRLFHDAANKIHMFDTLRIVSSVESSPLSILDIPDGDGAVRGTVRYDITL